MSDDIGIDIDIVTGTTGESTPPTVHERAEKRIDRVEIVEQDPDYNPRKCSDLTHLNVLVGPDYDHDNDDDLLEYMARHPLSPIHQEIETVSILKPDEHDGFAEAEPEEN